MSPLFEGGGGAEGAWLSGIVPRMSGVELRRPLCSDEVAITPDKTEFMPPSFLVPPFSAKFLTTPSTDAGRSSPTFPSFSSVDSSSGSDFERLRADWTSDVEVGASWFPPGPPHGESEESLLEKEAPLPTTIPLSGDWLLVSVLALVPWWWWW